MNLLITADQAIELDANHNSAFELQKKACRECVSYNHKLFQENNESYSNYEGVQ